VQRAANIPTIHAFRIFRDDFVFVYVDDIAVASVNMEQHQLQLRKVFERLRQFNLTINPAKCSFGKKSIDFLGHHIDSNVIKPLPEKVKAISDFPSPKVAKEVTCVGNDLLLQAILAKCNSTSSTAKPTCPWK